MPSSSWALSSGLRPERVAATSADLEPRPLHLDPQLAPFAGALAGRRLEPEHVEHARLGGDALGADREIVRAADREAAGVVGQGQRAGRSQERVFDQPGRGRGRVRRHPARGRAAVRADHEAARVHEVDGGVGLARGRDLRPRPQLRIFQEPGREQQERLPPPHRSQGKGRAADRLEQRAGPGPPLCVEVAGAALHAARAAGIEVQAHVAQRPAADHALNDAVRERVAAADLIRLVVRDVARARRRDGAARAEARRDGQQILTPFGQLRAPPGVAAGRGQGHFVSVPHGAFQKALDRPPARGDAVEVQAHVVQHQRESTTDARGLLVRGHGRWRAGRGLLRFRDEGLEADDSLGPAVLADDEVVPAEPRHRTALRIDDHHVQGDELDP
jgi:hypothetical protein